MQSASYEEVIHNEVSGPIVFSGKFLQEEWMNKWDCIATGIPEIDDALRGGVCTGEVTEFYGAPGHSKTQICLSIAVNYSLSQEGSDPILYLSSKAVPHMLQRYSSMLDRILRLRLAEWKRLHSEGSSDLPLTKVFPNASKEFFRRLSQLSPEFRQLLIDNHLDSVDSDEVLNHPVVSSELHKQMLGSSDSHICRYEARPYRSRLRFVEVSSASELLEALANIEKVLVTGSLSGGFSGVFEPFNAFAASPSVRRPAYAPRLLIVDSVSQLFTRYMGEGLPKQEVVVGNALLAEFSLRLRYLCATHGIAGVVTSVSIGNPLSNYEEKPSEDGLFAEKQESSTFGVSTRRPTFDPQPGDHCLSVSEEDLQFLLESCGFRESEGNYEKGLAVVLRQLCLLLEVRNNALFASSSLSGALTTPGTGKLLRTLPRRPLGRLWASVADVAVLVSSGLGLRLCDAADTRGLGFSAAPALLQAAGSLAARSMGLQPHGGLSLLQQGHAEAPDLPWVSTLIGAGVTEETTALCFSTEANEFALGSEYSRCAATLLAQHTSQQSGDRARKRPATGEVKDGLNFDTDKLEEKRRNELLEVQRNKLIRLSKLRIFTVSAQGSLRIPLHVQKRVHSFSIP